MILTNRRGTFERAPHQAEARRNGSFIDIHFTEDGVKKFIALRYSDIEWLHKLTHHGASMYLLIDFDEPRNFDAP